MTGTTNDYERLISQLGLLEEKVNNIYQEIEDLKDELIRLSARKDQTQENDIN